MAGFAFTGAPALAQVDIVKPQAPQREIAPEFRAEAERRALEKQKLALCQQKAATDKVLIRDRAHYIVACLDAK
ncbi:MAG: hypothetical protein ACR2K5_15130 [Pseudolabrys sp.]